MREILKFDNILQPFFHSNFIFPTFNWFFDDFYHGLDAIIFLKILKYAFSGQKVNLIFVGLLFQVHETQKIVKIHVNVQEKEIFVGWFFSDILKCNFLSKIFFGAQEWKLKWG